MDIQTKDGILLRGIPDGTPDEAIKARIAKIREERDEATPQIPKAEPRSLLEETGRQLGLTARHGIEGVGDTLELFSTPFRAGLNLVLPEGMQIRGRTGKAVADRLGLPTPETSTERVAGNIAQSMAAGGGFAKAMQMAVPAVSGVTNEVVQQLAKSPTSQIVAAGGAGAGSGLAREAEFGEGGQLAAGLLGSFLPFAAGKLAASTIGFGTDIAKGRVVDVRAGKALRAVAGDKRAAIEAEMAKQGGDLTAAQAAAEAGSTRWSALGKRAEDMRSEFFNSLRDKQAAAQRRLLSEAVGAPNQEMAILARGGEKGTLSVNVGPKLEQELAAANIAGKALPRLQGDANRFASAAADKVEDVRRFTAAGERADTRAQQFFPVTGQPRIPGRYSYADELAKRAERVAQSSADSSLILGEQARHSQMMADSLAKHGFKPLSADSLLSKIDREIRKAGTGDISLNEDVLSSIANSVKKAISKQGGRLDAKSLQAIRQTEIDDVVERVMKERAPNTSKERMASVVNGLKTSIDDAIEAAGGTGWKAAMSEWQQGMKELSRQKMNAVALSLFDKSPKKLVSLAKGNEPDMVKKVFPVGAPVLGFQMGGKDAAIRQVAKELERDMGIAKMAKAGREDVAAVLAKEASRLKLPMWLNRYATAANKGLDITETMLNQKTMEKVYKAMESGKSATEAMGALSTVQRNKVLKAMVEAKFPMKVRALQEASQRSSEQ